MFFFGQLSKYPVKYVSLDNSEQDEKRPWLLGANPSQLTRCLCVFHFVISHPVSDNISKPVNALIPGIAVTSTPNILFKYKDTLNVG
jgi:hypothetical protein